MTANPMRRAVIIALGSNGATWRELHRIRRISDRVLGGWIECDKLHASGWDFKAHLDLVRALGAH